MELNLLKKTKRHKSKPYLSFKGTTGIKWQLRSGFQNKNRRKGRTGFFEIELLIWLSVIFLILTGFMGIHKAYKKEHIQIKEDFQNEWNKLESKRRN